MRINVVPNLDQIRFFARSAKHAFDFQSPEHARETVIADMDALLLYLEAFDHGVGVAVAGISKIEEGIRVEVSTREGETFDLTDRYMKWNVVLSHSRNSQLSGEPVIEHMGAHDDVDSPHDERDFLVPVDRRTQE